jgi:hypothetical protein
MSLGDAPDWARAVGEDWRDLVDPKTLPVTRADAEALRDRYRDSSEAYKSHSEEWGQRISELRAELVRAERIQMKWASAAAYCASSSEIIHLLLRNAERTAIINLPAVVNDDIRHGLVPTGGIGQLDEELREKIG